MSVQTLNKMKNIQRLMMIAFFALAMVACKKDSELISPEKNSNSIVASQHNHTTTGRKSCASKAYMEEKMQDPTYRANHEKCMATFERNLKSGIAKSRSGAPTILPVAVHYQGVSNPDKACLVAEAKEAIAVLNADFQGKNSDIVQWTNNAASTYPSINYGQANLGFELGSKNHPSGFDLADGDAAVTINKTNGDSAPQWAGYINIFVGDAEGNLGWSPLGGSGNGDGMMISIGAFAIGNGCSGVTSPASNGLGRTLTHEMGHYLNLDHLWGDGGCSSDDNVTDTPSQSEPNYGCPSLGSTQSCGTQDLNMNFMDYADDACMYMFTAGQATRAEAWVASGLLNSLKTNVLGASTGTPTEPTGDDTDNDDTDTDNDTDIDTDTDEDTNTDDGEETDEEETDEEEGPINGATTSTITMQVTLDDFGSETTFAIEDGYGDVVAEFGPFEDGQEGTVIEEAIELATGSYTFVIIDTYGDGICCDVGNGKWKLFKDDAKIKSSNGKFGYWEEFDFTVGAARLSAPAHRIDTKKMSRNKIAAQKATAKR